MKRSFLLLMLLGCIATSGMSISQTQRPGDGAEAKAGSRTTLTPHPQPDAR